MKITELKEWAKNPENADIKKISSVEVDDVVVNVCTHLNEIGILAKADDDDKSRISLEVMDAVLTYTAHSIKVVLEVPYSLDLDHEALVPIAMNCDADLSILPPDIEPCSEDFQMHWERYTEKLVAYTETWLNQKNARCALWPAGGFLQYMIGEVFGHRPDTMATDQYMIQTFVSDFPVESVDYCKDKLRDVIHKHFDGEKGFEVFCHTLASSLGTHLNKVASEA